jgi:type IV secretory pathway protease TraF
MTGKTTVVEKKTSLSGSRSGSLKNASVSVSETARPLLTEDECMRLPGPQKDATGKVVAPGDMLIFCAGRPPIYGRQILYFLDPVFSRRAHLEAPLVGLTLPRNRRSLVDDPSTTQPQNSVDKSKGMKVILSASSLTLAPWASFGSSGCGSTPRPRCQGHLPPLLLTQPERGDLVMSAWSKGILPPWLWIGVTYGPAPAPMAWSPYSSASWAWPGDLLEIGQDGIAINGKVVAPKSGSVTGQPWSSHPEARGFRIDDDSGRLGLGAFRPASGGFDSRYFGWFLLATLHKVEPVVLIAPKGE